MNYPAISIIHQFCSSLLKARGGFEVNMSWKDNKLSTANIKSSNSNICKLKVNVPVKIFNNGKEIKFTTNAQKEIVFKTKMNGEYKLVSKL